MLFDPVVYVFREIEIAGDTYFQYFGLASECEVEEGTYIVPEYLLNYDEHYIKQRAHY